MNIKIQIFSMIILGAAASGCVSEQNATATNTAPQAASTPTPAEQACLRDVTATTNNPDVVLISSSFSEAGTEVIVGVGENRAQWRCIAYKDGTTADIQSLTDEGSL